MSKDKPADRNALLRKATLAAVQRHGPQCSVCALSPSDQAFVVEMRAMVPATTFRAISKGFAEVGITVPHYILSRHCREHVKA